MNPIASTGSIQAKLSGANLVTRLQTYASLLVQGVRRRFQVATEAFHDTLEAEKRLAGLAAQRTSRAQPTITRLSLGGFLVSQSSDRVFPVYEGSNFFALNQEGALLQRAGTSSEGADYKLRIQDSEAVLENNGDVVKPETFTSNESLTLGCEAFSLKLLPKEYRVVHEVSLPEEK